LTISFRRKSYIYRIFFEISAFFLYIGKTRTFLRVRRILLFSNIFNIKVEVFNIPTGYWKLRVSRINLYINL